jgi:hypothetical protein
LLNDQYEFLMDALRRYPLNNSSLVARSIRECFGGGMFTIDDTSSQRGIDGVIIRSLINGKIPYHAIGNRDTLEFPIRDVSVSYESASRCFELSFTSDDDSLPDLNESVRLQHQNIPDYLWEDMARMVTVAIQLADKVVLEEVFQPPFVLLLNNYCSSIYDYEEVFIVEHEGCDDYGRPPIPACFEFIKSVIYDITRAFVKALRGKSSMSWLLEYSCSPSPLDLLFLALNCESKTVYQEAFLSSSFSNFSNRNFGCCDVVIPPLQRCHDNAFGRHFEIHYLRGQLVLVEKWLCAYHWPTFRAFATDAFAHRHFWHSATCTNELDLVSGSAWMGVLADAMERIDVNWLESPRFCASITRVLDALEQPLQRLEKRASDSPWVKDELPKQREYFTEKIGYYGDLTPLIVGFVRYAKRANNRHLVLAIANSIGSLRRANEKIHGAVQSAQYLDEVVTRAISD